MAYTSQILAFIGLGLTFWGIILLFIRSENYTKKTLLDAATVPSLATLNQLIHELDYRGRAIYLPPKYLNTPEACKAYIPRHHEEALPPPEHIQHQDTILPPVASQGLLITPPGAELAKLLERILGTSFTQVDLAHLQQVLPRLLIEELELAQAVEFETTNNHVHVRIHNLALTNTTDHGTLHHPLDSLLPSAIACAIAKASGEPVITENQQTSQDGINLDIDYTLLTEKPQKE